MRYLRSYNLQPWDHMLNLLMQHEMGSLGPRQKQHCCSFKRQHRGSLGGAIYADWLTYPSGLNWKRRCWILCCGIGNSSHLQPKSMKVPWQTSPIHCKSESRTGTIGIDSALKSEDSQCPYTKQHRKRLGNLPLRYRLQRQRLKSVRIDALYPSLVT